MAYRLIWSPAARTDVDEIEAHIAATRSPVKARRVVERIWEAMRYVHEWRLMYRVEGSRVRVMRVVHGRRLLKNVPGSFDETPQAEYTAA